MGNHVHKLLQVCTQGLSENVLVAHNFHLMQPKSIDTIASNIRKISTTALQPSVTDITTKFTTVFNLFGTCHRGYNSSTYMGDDDIKQLGKHDNI